MTNNKNKNKNNSGKKNLVSDVKSNGRIRLNSSQLKMAPLATSLSYPSAQMSTRVRQRERVATITGATTFGVPFSSPVNPGLSRCFPWLAAQASQYEKYTFHSLKFSYRTLKGATYPGNIILGFDYDTLDAFPVTATAMTQLGVYNDGAVWDNFEIDIPLKRLELFMRSGVVPGDMKTYDIGRVYVGAEGCLDSTSQGYLEVEYDVSFQYKNTQVSSITNSTTSFFMMRTDGATETVAEDANVPFRSPIVDQYSITADANWFYTLPPGNWLVNITLYSNTSTRQAEVYYENSPYIQIPLLTAYESSSISLVVHSSGAAGAFYVKNVFGSTTYNSRGSNITFTPV